MSEIPSLRRADLEQFFGDNPRLLRAFEAQSSAIESATNGVADTQALKDATVIVLSANGDFTNERVLIIDDGLEAKITDTTVTLKVKDVARTSDYGVTLIPPAEVTLFLPPDGTLLSDTLLAAALLASNYANDAAASAGGIEIGELYHNAGAVRVRLV